MTSFSRKERIFITEDYLGDSTLSLFDTKIQYFSLAVYYCLLNTEVRILSENVSRTHDIPELFVCISFLALQEICFMTIDLVSFFSTGTCQPTENDISAVERIVVVTPVLK